MNIAELLTHSIKIAQRCQRNWDLSKPISDEICNTLKEIVKAAPTKQNEEFYSVIFLTDRKKIEKIYNFTDFLGQITTNDNEKNSQVLAPLLVIFCKETPKTRRKSQDSEYSESVLERDRNMGIGVASGQLALAAAQLGLSTGFCGCFNSNEVSKIIEHHSPSLLLGIGYPDISTERIKHQLTSKLYASYDKPISIITATSNSNIVEKFNCDNKNSIAVEYRHSDFANNIEAWHKSFDLDEALLNELHNDLYKIYKKTLVNPTNSNVLQTNNTCSIVWEGTNKKSLELFKQSFLSVPLIKQINSLLIQQGWEIN